MIDFQTENVEMPVLDFQKVKVWIRKVAANYNRKVGCLTYRFCSEEDILRYNREFINHDYYTDIITFDYNEGDVINGDILISKDTVASNASGLGLRYEDELLRVVVHGILHLCGINDHGPGEREIMEAEENKALKIYHEIK